MRIISSYSAVLAGGSSSSTALGLGSGGTGVAFTLGTLPLMHEYCIAEQLTRFQETAHDVQINIFEANQPYLLRGLDNGTLELAIVRMDYLSREKYKIFPLRVDHLELVCTASAATRFAGRKISLRDLRDENFVILDDSDIYTLCMDCFRKAESMQIPEAYYFLGLAYYEAKGVVSPNLQKAEEYFSAGELDKKVILAMRAAWDKFDMIFSEEVKEACLIHGDLNVGNIMVGKGYRITGFIDPLNSAYADREYDLFQFDNLTGKRFFLRETYIKKYGASRYCMQKLAFYGLWNEVYCYIKSGVLVNLIMKPLVKNMNKRLAEI